MNRASLLWLALLSSVLPACVSPPHQAAQPLVVMNSGIQINPDSEYLRGKRLHRQARYDEARQAYLSALTTDKNHEGARNGLAALMGSQGDLDRSIAILSSMAQSGTRLPQVYVNLGHAWIKKGQLIQARSALERALVLDPDNLAAQEKMAVLLSLEKTATADVTRDAASADPGTSVSPVNAVERLGDGLYVLRYNIPVREDLSQAAQKSAGVLLGVAAGGTVEAAVESTMTVPEARPERSNDRAPVRVIPVIAIVSTSEVKALDESIIKITAPSARSDFYKDSEVRRAVRSLAIEVANGNGVLGLARSLRGLLDGQSWRVIRTVNHKPFGVRFTRIEYVSDSAKEAKNLADALGIDAQLRLNNDQGGTQMRIILGHDLKDLGAIRQRLAATAQAAHATSVIPARSDERHALN